MIWRLVDFAADKQNGPLKVYKLQLQRTTSGQLDHEQTWKECLAVVKENLPFAIGYNLVDTFDIKKSTIELFSNMKDELTTLVANATWIDDSIRDMFQYKLKTLTPLIAYPRDGFSELEISAFYNEASIQTERYLQSLFELRIIDADNKLRQYFATSANVKDWKKYLPPTSLKAFYSVFDNTLRK